MGTQKTEFEFKQRLNLIIRFPQDRTIILVHIFSYIANIHFIDCKIDYDGLMTTLRFSQEIILGSKDDIQF